MQDNSSQGPARYRVVTGKDDASFWQRVSDAIDAGYVLHGAPAITISGDHLVLAQAVTCPTVACCLPPGDASVGHLLAPAGLCEPSVEEAPVL
jgi:hypothetical protein